MTTSRIRKLDPVSLTDVTISGSFWAPRQKVNRAVTLPIEYEQLESTGRIDAWRLDWQPGQPNRPHHFWDSDVAKWIEAAGYSLAVHPDPELEKRVDYVIDLIAEAQQENGYLNIHFTAVDPDNRWRNLRDMHELYCAGHLMEAAVAYCEGTGKRRLLDVLSRYADYIDTVFGPEENQKRGYPGHQEIELALVKLFRETGNERYLNLAKFFVDERGRQPHYFDIEAWARGEDPSNSRWGNTYDYNQAHLPVREQSTAEGHAVRAMYLYSGMADVAAETGDEALLAACRILWQNVTQRRMYVTGGIGSSRHGERFTYDYDLPNDVAYAETCAAIGLVFWAHRMLQTDCRGDYADVMERALYNGVLSGISLDGARFFYANPLEADPNQYELRPARFRSSAVTYERQAWFGCACCPPNIARLLASVGGYVYSQSENEVFVHLYTGSRAELNLESGRVALAQRTDYPWDGTVEITVRPEQAARFVLALRIPGWCQGEMVAVNGQEIAVGPVQDKGYARLDRIWEPGDTVTLSLPMPVVRIEAHPQVSADCGRVALQRGPLIYCLEEADNGPNLQDIALPRDAALEAAFDRDLLGGVVVIRGEAVRREHCVREDKLYKPVGSATMTIPIKAIPYYAWANRAPGEMLVWVREIRSS